MSGRIVTLTPNPVMDLRTSVDQVRSDRKLRCTDPVRQPGGGGLNVARTIRWLGGNACALFPAGGGTGEDIKHCLEGERLDYEAIPVAGETRENLIVLEEESGHEYRFAMPGPVLSQGEWEALLERLERTEPAPQYLVASGSLPPGVPEDFFARVAEVASRRGARVIVDTHGRPLERVMVPDSGVFLLKPNHNELEMLTGRKLASEEEEEAAARELTADQQARAVVLSRGPRGAMLVTQERTVRFRNPPVGVITRVGAGDSLIAGLVYRLAEGASLEEAVRYGVAVGAAAVASAGTGLGEWVDLEELVQQTEVA
ncbi:1-phosphofructokinase family hexose kinase [Thiohalorhabdus denitrificans]|uniref:Phosphofructokinase n=1 Tax=Thiohalorhabdus denitrificans TaxID=381306 RepID=A0A1G5AQV5_9GAMM|nr:1-phosphofructokinase family hexose kinase [Thiohalorhabdus denitrificans]SCX80268.1 6-phosphofructokinase 2 [Thiohalorhabdus denitrificans]